MSELLIERPETNYAVWKNKDGDIVCDFNDNANTDYPEDLTSYRDIGDLVSVVYKKGFSDGSISLKQQLSQQKALLDSAIKVIEKMSRNQCQCFVLEDGKCTPCAFLEKVKKC